MTSRFMLLILLAFGPRLGLSINQGKTRLVRRAKPSDMRMKIDTAGSLLLMGKSTMRRAHNNAEQAAKIGEGHTSIIRSESGRDNVTDGALMQLASTTQKDGRREKVYAVDDMEQTSRPARPDETTVVERETTETGGNNTGQLDVQLLAMEQAKCSTGTHSLGTLGAEVNAWDAAFEFNCPAGQVLSRLSSKHANSQEDRRWKFACGLVSGVTLGSCSWGSHTAWDAAWTIGDNNKVIAGVQSEHNNGKEDRKYKIKTCSVGTTTGSSGCAMTDWVNAYDKDLAYAVPEQQFLTRIKSQHSNSKEDRQFAFGTCTFCVTDPCVGVDCNGHGSCDNGNCVCDDDFEGSFCEEEITMVDTADAAPTPIVAKDAAVRCLGGGAVTLLAVSASLLNL